MVVWVMRAHAHRRSHVNKTRKLGLLAAAAMLSLGIVGVGAPANAMDTTWGCPTCLRVGHHQ
jgi:hypothetical protein